MNVGSATLVMIFCVMCLTVFAVLSLVTARNDLVNAEKSAKATEAYYAADTKAEEIRTSVEKGEKPGSVTFKDDGSALYTVSIDNDQVIDVALKKTAAGYVTERWKVVYTGEWKADDTLNLWDGNLNG